MSGKGKSGRGKTSGKSTSKSSKAGLQVGVCGSVHVWVRRSV